MSLSAKKILVNIVILALVLVSGVVMIVLKDFEEKIVTTTQTESSIIQTIE